MKFSNEAMRDVLLFLEEKVEYDKEKDDLSKKPFTIHKIVEDEYFEKLFTKHKYSKDELTYTIEKMVEGHIINCNNNARSSLYLITDISFYGIQLLEKIRPESIWEKTKKLASKMGNNTLNFIEDTAQQIAITGVSTLIEGVINQQN